MGAAFAIQVMTGKEQNVVKLMNYVFERNSSAQKWIKSVHVFVEQSCRLLKSGKLGKVVERPIMPGYIFLEMNYQVDGYNTSAHLPAELWHLVKSIPGVLKQFTRAGEAIDAEEFQRMLGVDEKQEEEVEVVIPVDEQISEEVELELEEAEQKLSEALHEANTVSTPEARVKAEQAVAVAFGRIQALTRKPFDELEEAKLRESVGANQAIKTLIHKGKKIVRFPQTWFKQLHDQMVKDAAWVEDPIKRATSLLHRLKLMFEQVE